MSYYLVDNPPNVPQGKPRVMTPTCIIDHTVEIEPVTDGSADGNAEAAARYSRDRTTPGNYHSINDTDSNILMYDPAVMTAYGCRYGFNAFAIHHSIASQAADFSRDEGWTMRDESYRATYALGAAEQNAQYCVTFDIPAVRITRAQALAGQRGILGHTDADPWRRHDPGFSEAEWEMFLTVVAHRIQTIKNPTPPVDAKLGDFVIPTGAAFDADAWRYPMWKWYTDGTVLPLFKATHHGDLSAHDLAAPVVRLVSTVSGKGYWLVAADGGIFGFGDAWYPSTHREFMTNIAPILVGEITTAILSGSGNHLILAASDGGIFDFFT